MKKQEIKAICFDLDGVFFTSKGKNSFHNALITEYGASKEVVDELMYRSPEMAQLVRGQISTTDFWNRLREITGITASDEELTERWVRDYEIDKNVLEGVMSAKSKGYQTCVCTNNNGIRLPILIERYGLNSLFDVIVSSHEVGTTKPNKEIFQALLTKLGVSPQELVYSDDNPERLFGAKELGIHTFQFHNFEQYLGELSKIGIDLKKNITEQILERLKMNYDFGEIIGDPIYPKQGLSSAVFFLKFSTGKEVVVKYGDCVDKDLLYIKLINENKVGVEVPEIYGYFQINNIHILLLEKIKGKLFGDVEKDDLPKYFDTVISTLQELHKLKKKENNWKQYLLDIFNGETINWDEVLERKIIDKNLLQSSLQEIKELINNLDFEDEETSLLHTDFNQSNLFIEEKTCKITGVIDWEEAVFGDPIYDYARFHLHLWHREVDENTINSFLERLNLNNTQKKNEQMYFLFFILHYIAYYSESSDEFRLQRVKIHQDFLRNNFTK